MNCDKYTQSKKCIIDFVITERTCRAMQTLWQTRHQAYTDSRQILSQRKFIAFKFKKKPVKLYISIEFTIIVLGNGVPQNKRRTISENDLSHCIIRPKQVKKFDLHWASKFSDYIRWGLFWLDFSFLSTKIRLTWFEESWKVWCIPIWYCLNEVISSYHGFSWEK